MASIKLFRTTGKVAEIPATSVTLERELQTLIENNMQQFFGVTFLKSEHVIPEGRIDSLGIDENYSPVIFEYKRSLNENVISQGLFYLDWLLSHRADFKLLVLEKLGMDYASHIDWSFPCVYCIASEFTRYDIHAINQMQRNIQLVKYKKFGDDLVFFEFLNTPNNIQPIKDEISGGQTTPISKPSKSDKSFDEQIAAVSTKQRDLYFTIRDYILSLGDDITENKLKLYIAFRKTRNFATIDMTTVSINLCLRLNPDDYSDRLKDGFIRDVRKIGHWGTGDLQVILKSYDDYCMVQDLILMAYMRG